MFAKLKDLDTFRVNKYNGFSFKMWDNENKKMLTSKTWFDGYRKMHSLSIESGGAEDNTLEVSDDQIGQMLRGVMQNGMANILGREFRVKTNGKTGMEIRYFINPVFNRSEPQNEPVNNDIRMNDPLPQENNQSQSVVSQNLPTQTASPGDPDYISPSDIPF